ncbi:MAG: hypothetical protein LBD85_05615 [Oscillospiraceae bacterium]|jgi:hypothetical protein|nr:hypothetical protein [Oscillospiraceae bacterium]
MNKTKKENTWFRIITALIALTAVCYLYFYSYEGISKRMRTAVAVRSEVYNYSAADGLIIRDEKLIRGASGERYVYVTAVDAKRVAAGEEIAVSFDAIDAWTATRRVYELDAKIEALEGVMIDGGISEVRLDAALSAGVNEIKTAVRRQDYRAAGEKSAGIIAIAHSGLNAESELAALKSERANLGTYTAQRITADTPGVFSRYADGYVGDPQISAADIAELDANRLRVLLNMQPAAAEDAIGKLVTGSVWYFAAIIDGDTASAITGQVGKRFTLDMSESGVGQLSVTLVSVSYSGVGDSLAVFSGDTALTEVINLRKVTANLVLNHYKGLAVPRDALRLEYNADDVRLPCVYILQGPYAKRKFVEIIAEEEDFYIVAEDIYSATALKAGDSLITAGKNLYDGKVVN